MSGIGQQLRTVREEETNQWSIEDEPKFSENVVTRVVGKRDKSVDILDKIRFRESV
jgi:hypothetical protein